MTQTWVKPVEQGKESTLFCTLNSNSSSIKSTNLEQIIACIKKIMPHDSIYLNSFLIMNWEKMEMKDIYSFIFIK